MADEFTEDEFIKELDRAICRLGLAMVLMDGEITEEEKQTFYEKLSALDVSVEAFNEAIEEDIDEIIEKMPATIEFVSVNINIDARGTLLDTLEDLAYADGEMDSNENHFLNVLAKAWGY